MRPDSLRIRMYNVGFGDCFLLSFRYPDRSRHILIDFGTTKQPEGERGLLARVAKQIEHDCGGQLDGLVATHRHRDHIRGFETNSEGTKPGNIIARLAPKVVIQPWTEDPAAQPDATAPTRYGPDSLAFARGLASMDAIAAAAEHGAESTRGLSSTHRGQLAFLGEINISNRSAVENLRRMGENGKGRYVFFESESGLDDLLPGVEVYVLGPPTLEQSSEIRSQRRSDPGEYWQLRSFRDLNKRLESPGDSSEDALAEQGGRNPVFPDADYHEDDPIWSRWFKRHVKKLRGDSLLRIVRILDKALNNTSVILLFKVGSQSALFSGDAQIENWQFALGQPWVQKLLQDVTVYKVGHHGSRNATPRSLWKLFKHRGGRRKRNRMYSMMSTLEGFHGKKDDKSEVPRETLVGELRNKSDYRTTQKCPQDANFHDVELDFGSDQPVRSGASDRGPNPPRKKSVKKKVSPARKKAKKTASKTKTKAPKKTSKKKSKKRPASKKKRRRT